MGLGLVKLGVLVGVPEAPRRVAMIRQTGMKIMDKDHLPGHAPCVGVMFIEGDKINEKLLDNNLPNSEIVNLRHKRLAYNQSLKALETAKTKADWTNLVNNAQKPAQKIVKNIYEQRMNSMRHMAFRKDVNMSELTEFMGRTPENFFANQANINKGVWGDILNWKLVYKAPLKALDLPFVPGRVFGRHHGDMINKMENILLPAHSSYLFSQQLTAEETAQAEAELQAQKTAATQQLQTVNAKIEKL
jgi:hypothetical protein